MHSGEKMAFRARIYSNSVTEKFISTKPELKMVETRLWAVIMADLR